MDFWWGSGFWGIALPGYLTGLGTLALATATFFTLKSAAQERRDRLDFQERADARHVVMDDPRMTATGQGQAPGWLNTTWVVHVQNNGEEPIAHLRVMLRITGDVNVLEPVLLEQTHPGRLMGGKPWDATFHVQLPHDDRSNIGSAVALTINQASLMFTDSAGYKWGRDYEHLLYVIDRPTTATAQRKHRRKRGKNSS